MTNLSDAYPYLDDAEGWRIVWWNVWVDNFLNGRGDLVCRQLNEYLERPRTALLLQESPDIFNDPTHAPSDESLATKRLRYHFVPMFCRASSNFGLLAICNGPIASIKVELLAHNVPLQLISFNGPTHVGNTHFPMLRLQNGSRRLDAANTLAAIVQRLDFPTIIGGDYNAPRRSPLARRLQRHLRLIGPDGTTWRHQGHSRIISAQLDYLFGSPGASTLGPVDILDMQLSDHSPIATRIA